MAEAVESTDAEIKRRQQLLFDAFRHEGVLGGRYLVPTIEMETAIGEKLSDTYYGHRVLTRVLPPLHARLRVHRTPGFPCALCLEGARFPAKLRAHRAARMRRCGCPSRRGA
jgi:hypothetical protein